MFSSASTWMGDPGVPAVMQWLGGSRFTTVVAAVLQRAHGTLLPAN